MWFLGLSLTYAASICSTSSESIEKTLQILQERLQKKDCDSTMEMIRTMNSLNIENSEIEDIFPLQEAKKLRVLLMANNNIVDLSPLQHISLRWLDISENPISDLSPLSNMHELETLWGTSMAVIRLEPLEKLQKLRYLSVENNQIEDISVIPKIKNLKFLGLSRNAIKDFRMLSGHRNLQFMTLKENPVIYCPEKGLLSNICNQEKNK